MPIIPILGKTATKLDDEATDSDYSEKEENEIEVEAKGKRKRKCSMKARRVKTPELISRLGIEAGALLDDSQSSDSDSDDDYTITKVIFITETEID